MTATPEQRERAANAWGAALTIGVAFNGALVIAKEMSSGLRGAMVAATGHHWTTHGAATALLFLALGGAFGAMAKRAAPRWMERLASAAWQAGSVAISCAAILGYYATSHWG